MGTGPKSPKENRSIAEENNILVEQEKIKMEKKTSSLISTTH